MRHFTIAAAFSLVSLSVQAAELRTFADQRALAAEAKISVRNLAGVIEVEGWDKAEFDLAATLGESAEKVEITGNANDLRVEVKNRRTNFSYGDGDTRLKLRVPAAALLNLEGTSTHIVVRGTRGSITANSVSGDVDLAVAARQINAQTVSGDLRLDAPAARETKLNTVSGDTRVRAVSGALSAESVSGDVEIQGGSFAQLDLKSVSGDIGVQTDFAGDAQVKAESLSGDVRVNVPATLSAEATLKSFSGELRSDFQPVRAASSSKRLVLKIGEGRGQFLLTSFSGDVTLDKQ